MALFSQCFNRMKNFRNYILFVLAFTITANVKAQDSAANNDETLVMYKTKSKKKIVGYMLIDGDSIPLYQIEQVLITPIALDSASMAAFTKLRRNIKVVLPYAKLAAFKLQLMEDNLKNMTSKKQRKKYTKEVEKSIKEEFMKELQNLTMSQGKLLLKLIHRETGKTTWDIMSNYSGGLETIFWQAMAKTYNTSMKETFDPARDWQIDFIIRKLELE